MEVSSCPECKSNVTLFDNLSSRMGFAHKLELSCENCGWKYETFTSNTCTPPVDINISAKQKQGRKPFEVNVRTVLSFREIGRGHEHIKMFSRIMNMFCRSIVNAVDYGRKKRHRQNMHIDAFTI